MWICPRGTGDGNRALGLGLTTHLVPWLVCAPYGRAAAGRAPPGTSWGLCLPALAPLYAPIPPLPLGGPAGEYGWGRANTGFPHVLGTTSGTLPLSGPLTRQLTQKRHDSYGDPAYVTQGFFNVRRI